MAIKEFIGGFFELELKDGGSIYHPDAIPLSNGRACLSLIIQKQRPAKLYVPYYSCDALYEPIKDACEYDYYSIDENFEIVNLPHLGDNEYLIYINYFGLKNGYVEKLKTDLGKSLIIDETHNFFGSGHQGFWSFTSARKYFGVPDGAYLYSPYQIEEEFVRNTKISLQHLANRLLGNQKLAYEQFLAYEKSLGSQINKISIISERLLSNIDYTNVRVTRRKNFEYYRKTLSDINLLTLDEPTLDPFCYPLLVDREPNRSLLFADNIFIPTFWPDVLLRGHKEYGREAKITKNLLPLPVDHRYSPDDLERVSAKIKEIVEL